MERPDPIPPLVRAARYRRRWLRRLVRPLVGAALAIRLAAGHDPELGCVAAEHDGPAAAIAACERELLATGAPETGARLAEAHRAAGHAAVAGALANGLLVTPARADALWVLGAIALDEGRRDAARNALTAARDLHRAAGRLAELARDELALRRLDACSL